MSTTKGKYRPTDQIVAAIIQTAGQGSVSRTKIMFGAYISYGQSLRYLDELVRAGLLEENCERFSTTDKGFKWLELHQQQAQLITVAV